MKPYITVAVTSFEELQAVREATARPWLEAYKGEVSYWAEDLENAERERTALALAGIRSFVEMLDV